jgi:hypothetical protein
MTEFNDLDETHKKIELLRARLRARLAHEDLDEDDQTDNKKNVRRKKIRQIKVPIIPPEYVEEDIESDKKKINPSKKNEKIKKPYLTKSRRIKERLIKQKEINKNLIQKDDIIEKSHLIKARNIRERLSKQKEMKQIEMNKNYYVKSMTNRHIVIILLLLIFISTLGGIFSTGFLNMRHENNLIKLAEINYSYNKLVTTHTGSNFLKIYSALYRTLGPTFIQLITTNVVIRYLMRILLSPLTFIFNISEMILDYLSINSEIAATTSILVAASLFGIFYFTPLFLLSSRVRRLFKNKVSYILLITSIGLVILSQNIYFIFMNSIGILSCSIIIMLVFGSHVSDFALKIFMRLNTK